MLSSIAPKLLVALYRCLPHGTIYRSLQGGRSIAGSTSHTNYHLCGHGHVLSIFCLFTAARAWKHCQTRCSMSSRASGVRRCWRWGKTTRHWRISTKRPSSITRRICTRWCVLLCDLANSLMHWSSADMERFGVSSTSKYIVSKYVWHTLPSNFLGSLFTGAFWHLLKWTHRLIACSAPSAPMGGRIKSKQDYMVLVHVR